MVQGRVSNESQITTGAQTEMANSVAAIKKTINDVTASIDAARPGWQGDAFTAANRAADGWSGEAARLNAILDELTALVGQGDTTYVNLDSTNEQDLGRLATTGGGYTNL